MNTIYISIIKQNAPHLNKVLLNLSTNNSRMNREMKICKKMNKKYDEVRNSSVVVTKRR